MTTTTELPPTNQETINLFQLGCLVNLKIRMWSGRKRLTKNDIINMGYDPEKLPDDVVNLGGKFLVSKDELDVLTKLAQRGRNCLDKWSIPFGISNAHFLPTKMIPTIEEQLKEIKKEYEAAVDSFIARFSDMRVKMQQDHPEFWEKCLKNCYPATPSLLRNRYSFDWFKFEVTGANTAAITSEELAAREEVRQERTNELRSQMQTEVNHFVENYVQTMRGETIKFCELMTARLNGQPYGDEEEPKKLAGRAIASYRKYADRFKNMNIFGDSEIEKMLEDFKQNFLGSEVTANDFDNADVKESATQALAAIRQLATDEGESASEFIGQLKRRIII
jgi:hypothetical protein